MAVECGGVRLGGAGGSTGWVGRSLLANGEFGRVIEDRPFEIISWWTRKDGTLDRMVG
jgi:hypothetical protein